MTTPGGGIWLAPPEPGDVSRVLEAVVAAGPLGGGGTFYVDPERAEECIRQLRAVAVNLIEVEQLTGQAYFPPPGTDLVSRNAAREAGIMANHAAHYVSTWRIQLEQTAAALDAQLMTYLAAEEAQRARLA
ncbi:hypothetical protein BJF78_18250 [Pseudonocardia sp. CNS-139]|nr:hypothetical protein BJF78_18250 [Pseudonocardia sp. CNS-139]